MTASVRKAILSFPNGSGSGHDLLRPQHLKDIISPSLEASANSVLRSISRFASFVSSTKISGTIRHLFFGAHLNALQKKGGGIRPIAVGNTFRRLFAKLSLQLVMNSLREDLLPCQLGVDVRLGFESAVHATRSFIKGLVGNFHFQPVAFETMGCCGLSTSSFVEELGRKVIEASEDPLEAVWLRQKISLAIVIGNATSILSSFSSGFFFL